MEVLLAAQKLQVIDFVFGGKACGAHIRCFCLTPWCDCVIYGPPVARTSDLFGDTELTVPVLVMALCAPQCPEEQFRPATYTETLPHAPDSVNWGIWLRWALDKSVRLFKKKQQIHFLQLSDSNREEDQSTPICIQIKHADGKTSKAYNSTFRWWPGFTVTDTSKPLLFIPSIINSYIGNPKYGKYSSVLY